jgi:methyl-accepting chemotaxis protein
MVAEQQTKISQNEDIDAIDIDEWLRAIQKTYTTLEQVDAHSGKGANNKKPENSEITFF